MLPGAANPEELETLFEDAFILHDQAALSEVFEPGAVLVAGRERHEARGRDEIVGLAREMWALQRIHVAEPRRVLQVGDTALILAVRAASVARRSDDGVWRYAISVVDTQELAKHAR